MSPPVRPPRDLAEALESASARLHPFGLPLVYFHETESTNDVAGHLAAQGTAEGTTVVADAQTRGRGRSGRTWFSPPGAGLYLSVVLRPTEVALGRSSGPPPWTGLLTLAAGVALADGIEAATGLRLEIKWPNDLVVSRGHGPREADRHWRKVAGILAEGHTVQGDLRHVVLGYGINLQPAGYPANLAGRASALETELGRAVDRAAVLVETLAALRREYAGLREGRCDDLLGRWRARSPSAHGALVAWTSAGHPREGTTAGIDRSGALLVGHAGGIDALHAGEVTWR